MGKPGPKGPSKEVVDAIVVMKRRNPRFGCPRIAQQINLAFGLEIDKDVDRRILAKHYRPDPGGTGMSIYMVPGGDVGRIQTSSPAFRNPSSHRCPSSGFAHILA